MQKSTLLKVISVLFIIFGALGIFSALGNFSSNAAFGALGIVSSLLSIIAAAMQLVAGLLGIQQKDNLDVCKKLALVLIVMAVLSGGVGIVVVTSVAGSLGVSAGASVATGVVTGVIATIFGLLLPVLYMIGVNQSAKA